MKKVNNVTVSQAPASFKDESGKEIAYKQYILYVGGKEIIVKPLRGKSKFFLEDIFDGVKEE